MFSEYYTAFMFIFFFLIIFISGASSETKDQETDYAFSSTSHATIRYAFD